MTWEELVKRSPPLPAGCVPGPVSICCDKNNEPILCVGEAASVAAKVKPCGCSGAAGNPGENAAGMAIHAQWPKSDVFELIDKLRAK
jgi:hypothetical protein